MFSVKHMKQLELKSIRVLTLIHPKIPSFLPLFLLLTLQVCPSSKAAL